MNPALAMSDVVQCVVASSLRLIQNSVSTGEIAVRLATVVRDSPGDEEFRLRLVPLTTVLPPFGEDGSLPEVGRDALAWGLYGTILNFSGPTDLSEDLAAVRGLVEVAGQRLKKEILKESQPPSVLSGIFQKVSVRELSSEVVQRQMMDTLKGVVLGTLHDANNFLAPLVTGITEAKVEAAKLIAIVDENVHHLPEEVRPLVPQYAGAIAKNVQEIDSLLDQTVPLIRKVQSIVNLSNRVGPDLIQIPRLFEDGGFMNRIHLTVEKIHADLIEGHRELAGLFALSKSHGHILPKDVFDEGMGLLRGLEDCFNVFRDLVILIAELFNLLKDVVAGINQKPGAILLDERLTLLKQRMLGAVMGKWVHVKFDLAPEPWPVWGFPIHISQLILNLACNARDAMNHSGSLTVGTRRVVLRPEDVEELAGMFTKPENPKPGRYMAIRIQDSGPGIPSETLPRIFEVGMSGKGSSGIGLSVVLKLVRDMGGFLTVASETVANEKGPRGTTFTLYLPEA